MTEDPREEEAPPAAEEEDARGLRIFSVLDVDPGIPPEATLDLSEVAFRIA